MLNLDQSHVDCLAAFAEACSEMGREPFFILGNPVPNYNGNNESKRITFFMGDRLQFRSGLIPFQRLWSKTGPAHWEKTASILEAANLPLQLKFSAKADCEMIRNEIARTKSTHYMTLTTGQIIDLWLNIMMTQIEDGSSQRAEFERNVAAYSHAEFEFRFRFGVKTVGYYFQRLFDYVVAPSLELARNELNLVPSFKIGAANDIKRRVTMPDGTTILRQGTSDHGHNETFEGRYIRLLNCYDNASLQHIFNRLEASQGELLRAVLWCSNFTELLESVEGQVDLTQLPWTDAGRHRTDGFRGSAALGDGVWFYLYENNVLVTGAKVVPILDQAVLRLRNQLLAPW